MATIARKEYVGLFGPTVGDRIRLGDTGLFVEIERDLRGAPGDEIVFGGGKSLREGMGMDNRITRRGGAPDLVITNVTIIDAILGVVKADVGIKDGRICAIGKAGNPQMMDGITPGLECGLATDAISGNHLILTAAGIDTHIHFISPQQAYAALSNGTTTLIGGGTGPSDGSNATTVTPGPGQHPHDAARLRELADQRRHPRQGPRARQGGAGRAGRGRRGRLQVPRGLGHDAGGAALVADGRRRDGRAGVHTHRHAQRVGLRREHDRRVRRPYDPLVPHRRLRRRPRAGHHQDLGAAERAAVLDQSDAPLRHQFAGRAVRHDHGVPPPQPRHPVGRGVHREPHPRRDHRRRERAARPRRDLDDVERFAGHGPHRRMLAAHHPDRRRDEDRPRQAAGGRQGQRQLPRAALRGEDHHQPGDHARHLARARLGRGRQDRRPGAVGAGVLRCQAEARAQGRRHHLGR